MNDIVSPNLTPDEKVAHPEVAGGSKENNIYAAFILEINRSFEHYQIQRGQTSPSRLFIDPGFKNKDVQSGVLHALPIKTELLDIAKLYKLERPIEDNHQVLCLSVIGAGFRSEEEKSGEVKANEDIGIDVKTQDQKQKLENFGEKG